MRNFKSVKKNTMILNSHVRDISRELFQNDRALRDRAGTYVMREIRNTLSSGGPTVPEEHRKSFRKGLKKRSRRFYTLVGIGKPGFHAFNVEHGHDIIRNGVKVGEAPAYPFKKPSWERAAPGIRRILSEKRIRDD